MFRLDGFLLSWGNLRQMDTRFGVSKARLSFNSTLSPSTS